MIYKDYFINAEFEDVWHTLQTYYNEPEGVRNLYKTLFYTIRNLPVDEGHSGTPLTVMSDFEGKIYIAGAPDPVEWLTGREVLLEIEEKPSDIELAAHLLYWSTLYDFSTQTRHHKDYQQYLDSLENGTVRYSLENPDKALSRQRKQCYYWKETIAYDSAIDWSYILDILRKRIEYHIGYHRFTDRFTNSKHYVKRMELCCRLLELAAADYYDMDGIYVNTRNASRYIGHIFSQYDYDKIGEYDKFKELRLSEIRRAKAYKILWKFLDHNLTYWWD
ncbi:MAG: hypothetical protein HDS74_01545 [Bacteroidales bacterium]|nr:hypothetical protein [Bacteroidales bacterium]MBD5211771.1 hypothetical protein [Bacteroidales bacterium]